MFVFIKVDVRWNGLRVILSFPDLWVTIVSWKFILFFLPIISFISFLCSLLNFFMNFVCFWIKESFFGSFISFVLRDSGRTLFCFASFCLGSVPDSQLYYSFMLLMPNFLRSTCWLVWSIECMPLSATKFYSFLVEILSSILSFNTGDISLTTFWKLNLLVERKDSLLLWELRLIWLLSLGLSLLSLCLVSRIPLENYDFADYIEPLEWLSSSTSSI